jgi:cellulose synthase/poly-beta-1,6-N-acetylglucosamine synthase-like glycosyltransferase
LSEPWSIIYVIAQLFYFFIFGAIFYFLALLSEPWSIIYVIAQLLYLFAFVVMLYFLTRKVNWVDSSKIYTIPEEQMPLIVLAYPVLREDENTIHTTMVSLSKMDYPKSKYRIIAIPNSDDMATIEILRRFQAEFPFLEVLEVPPTSNPSWNVVWRSWANNTKAYWFHEGKTKWDTNLPPKKTRQLIYLFYTLVSQHGTDWVLDYIDADSITPSTHFRLAAVGLQQYDVLQATNVVGNPLDTWATSFHSFDHMCWDGNTYPHMSADGKHPYYVLGKGLFYKAKDLFELGCFNPWITIEDPEVGLRLWTNRKRLGIIAEPLVEEVPRTFRGGIIQRNRWMCGFFQTLSTPLKQMGMKFWHRQLARLNFVPTLSLLINLIGLPTGAYALYLFITSYGPFPPWVVALSAVNIILYVVVMGQAYWNAWKRTKLVLSRTSSRVWYMLRINPLFLFLYYLLWSVPIAIGFGMFLADKGRAWARTEKVDADRRFVSQISRTPDVPPTQGQIP